MKLFPKKNEEKTTKISLGTMYDINKDLVSKINDLTKEELEEKKNLVIEFLENTDNHYYMLLCNERKDYTIFHRGGGTEALQDILLDECIIRSSTMKTNSFLVWAVLGAAAAVAVSKKFFNCCSCENASDDSVPNCTDNAEKKTVDEAEKSVPNDTIEQLRNSIDSLRKELSSRIESEQTFAAKCEDLKDQIAKQNVEISNLKNVCEMQDSRNKKLEEELASKK